MTSIKGIFIGAELCDGRTLNSNHQHIAASLTEKGFYMDQAITIDDSITTIIDTLNHYIPKTDVLILTGGLGPTDDDRTREAVSKATNLALQQDEHALAAIQAYFSKTNRVMPTENTKQALFPKEATLIPNLQGTAPGFHLMFNSCHIFALPGVPSELKAMFKDSVIPTLHSHFTPASQAQTHLFKCHGIGESHCAEKLKALYPLNPGLEISYQAKPSDIHIRLHVSNSAAPKDVTSCLDMMAKALADVCYTTDPNITLAHCIIEHCKANTLRLALAESCTGGAATSALVAVPGASDVIDSGLISYSNEAKSQWLGIPAKLIETHGAVSKNVVCAMAEHLRNKTGTDLTVAISGIAGPSGGTAEKPVGTVFFAISSAAGTEHYERFFSGDRAAIQQKAAVFALSLLFSKC